MKLLTVKEAAKILRVEERTLYLYLKKGLIPYHLISKKTIRIDESDLLKFLNQSKRYKL